MTLRLAWFASAKGTSSRLLFNAAVDAIADGRLDAEIVCVVCNRVEGQSANTDAFLKDVRRAEVPLIASSSLEWRRRVGGQVSVPGQQLASWRRDYDQHLYEQLREYAPDVGMLAGYMLIVTDVICKRLPSLNLHPALPDGPIGTWQQVIHQLITGQARSSGMMLQRVTTELDRGPTVTWAQYPIRGPQFDSRWEECGRDAESETPLFHAIRAAGVRREPTFILQSLQHLASYVGSDGVLDSAAISGPGVEITAAVEAELQRLSE